MIVTVRLYGSLRRFSSPENSGCWQGCFPESTRVRDVLARLGAEEREVAVVSCSGVRCGLDCLVKPGAELVVVPYIGGG